MCFACSLYMPLLTERDNSVDQGYKHLAPPEQGTSANKETGLFGQSRFEANQAVKNNALLR